MTQTTFTNNAGASSDEVLPYLAQRVSWGAIFAGALIAVGVSMALNILGVAIGASTVNLAQGSTPSVTTFGVGTAIWLILSTLIALATGSYAAAHLSGIRDRGTTAWHGVAVWALATLVAAGLLGSVTGNVIGIAGSGVASIVRETVGGVGNVAAGTGVLATKASPPDALQTTGRQLIDRAQSALMTRQGDPAQMTSDQRKAEIASLIGQGIGDGTFSQADHDRLVSLVAAETGMTPDQARARIDQVQQRIQDTVQKAKEKARQITDAAAHATTVAAFWTFGTLALGAVISVLAAFIGARAPTYYPEHSRGTFIREQEKL